MDTRCNNCDVTSGRIGRDSGYPASRMDLTIFLTQREIANELDVRPSSAESVQCTISRRVARNSPNSRRIRRADGLRSAVHYAISLRKENRSATEITALQFTVVAHLHKSACVLCPYWLMNMYRSSEYVRYCCVYRVHCVCRFY